MKRKFVATLSATALLVTSALPGYANGLKEAVQGSWELVSLTVVKGEKRINLFGEGARGMQVMMEDVLKHGQKIMEEVIHHHHRPHHHQQEIAPLVK